MIIFSPRNKKLLLLSFLGVAGTERIVVDFEA